MDQRSPEQRSISENIQSWRTQTQCQRCQKLFKTVFGKTLKVIAFLPHSPLLLHATDLYNCYLNVMNRFGKGSRSNHAAFCSELPSSSALGDGLTVTACIDFDISLRLLKSSN